MIKPTNLDDRRWWPEIEAAWKRGRQAFSPAGASPQEWRSCARRLARHLKVKVFTREIADHRAIACIDWPLGMDDEEQRRRYDETLDRQAADRIGEMLKDLKP